jgi:hypothetical protein
MGFVAAYFILVLALGIGVFFILKISIGSDGQ